jgi:hypothetical protein
MSEPSHCQMAWQSGNNEIEKMKNKAIIYWLELLLQNVFREPEEGNENFHYNI